MFVISIYFLKTLRSTLARENHIMTSVFGILNNIYDGVLGKTSRKGEGGKS